MPPNDNVLQNALDKLDALQKKSKLTASPVAIMPFQSATLTWEVRATGTVGQLSLNGRNVAKSGSMSVTPLVTTNFALTTRIAGGQGTLATATVTVDTAACLTLPIPEAAVRSELEKAIKTEFKHPQIKIKGALIEVDPVGVRVKVKANVTVPAFPDPEVTATAIVNFTVSGNRAVAVMKSFDLDVSLGISVPEFLFGSMEASANKSAQQAIQKQLDKLLSGVPSKLQLHSIRTKQDLIEVTVCPKL